jgi:hypothetical protein
MCRRPNVRRRRQLQTCRVRDTQYAATLEPCPCLSHYSQRQVGARAPPPSLRRLDRPRQLTAPAGGLAAGSRSRGVSLVQDHGRASSHLQVDDGPAGRSPARADDGGDKTRRRPWAGMSPGAALPLPSAARSSSEALSLFVVSRCMFDACLSSRCRRRSRGASVQWKREHLNATAHAHG